MKKIQSSETEEKDKFYTVTEAAQGRNKKLGEKNIILSSVKSMIVKWVAESVRNQFGK